MGLSILSQNLLIELLSQWIDTIDLVSYDTAICNHAMRELYHSLGIELALCTIRTPDEVIRYIHVCMYCICMYVCMYVCLYACMYVCMWNMKLICA